MEVCVKQEKFDTDFETETGRVPWEVIGPWVQTDAKIGHRKSSAELVIPLGQPSSAFDDLNRAKREFVPDEKKDLNYWNKRIKNNASARRSRLKKKCIERNMEAKLQELQRENIELKYELAALKRHFAGQLESKHDDVSEARSDLSMRSGSGSDTSDSGSVHSEGEGCNSSYESDRVVSQSFGSQSHRISQNVFPYNGWAVPINYSFMTNTIKGSNSESSEGDSEVRAKLPHKFRHKKDFHSAFYVHPFSETD